MEGPSTRDLQAQNLEKASLSHCPDSQEIVFVQLTDHKTPDHKVYPKFLSKASRTVKRTYGDGAYDRAVCYQANFHHGSKPVVPPQKNARYRKDAPDYLHERNISILEIRGLGGDDEARKLWKRLRGYHLRSLAETGMYRFKALFGGNMQSRIFSSQQAEVYAKSLALNKMTLLGMPMSKKIVA